MKYDFTAIEQKWQQKWLETKPFTAVTGDPRPKFYGLIEIPPARACTWAMPGPSRPWTSSVGEADAGLQRPLPHGL